MIFFILTICFVKVSFSIVCDPEPGSPPNEPMGKPKGLVPGRVAWYYNRSACYWDGNPGSYWWGEDNIDYYVVDDLVEGTILSLGNVGKSGDPKNAWKNIFENFKSTRGKEGGYVKGEKIAIKANLDVWLSYKLPPPNDNTRMKDDPLFKPNGNANSVSPQMIKAVFRQLVENAEVNEDDIMFYDASRPIPIHYHDFWYKDYPDIQYWDNQGGMPYSRQVNVDYETMLYFSDKDIKGWNATKFPTVLTDADYLIEITAFEGHNAAGVSLTPKNMFGSIYTVIPCTFLNPNPGNWCPIPLHPYINITGIQFPPNISGGYSPQRPMKTYTPMVDLLGHDDVGGKGLLYLVDALYAGIDETFQDPIKFSMTPFNEDWTCSVFGSQDPVAVDSVCFDFLRSENNEPWPTVGCTDNYLHEESLANDPPSGTNYQPSGHAIDSLGVHEHWNNVEEKKYSRDLGTGNGIELVKVHET